MKSAATRDARVDSDGAGTGLIAATSDTASTLALLVVEDSEADFELLIASLERSGSVTAARVETSGQLRDALASARWDAVIADHKLPRFDSLEALRIVRAAQPDLPFLIVSGMIGEEAAVAAMQAGADDYIMKDHLSRAAPALQRALIVGSARGRQRETEEALRESEARFRSLASNLPGLVLQIHVEDGGTLAFHYASSGSQRLFGIAADDLVREPGRFFDLLQPADAADLRIALRKSLQPPKYIQHECRLMPGCTVATAWIEFSARPRRLPSGRLLWHAIVSDISPQKRADQEARALQRELRELSSYLVRVREQEREAIAREIHDEVGSILTAIKLDIAWFKQQLRNDAALLDKLRQFDQLVDRAGESSTRLVHDLRPGILDAGIVAALEWVAHEFERRAGTSCRFDTPHEWLALEPDQSITVFRICQEALNNIAKHAAATQVNIWLATDDLQLLLEVRDNGGGFTPEKPKHPDCFGLRGMKERAMSLGGTVDISSEPGSGTTIALALPLSTLSENNNIHDQKDQHDQGCHR
jgi:signal transduction histidine kinase